MSESVQEIILESKADRKQFIKGMYLQLTGLPFWQWYKKVVVLLFFVLVCLLVAFESNHPESQHHNMLDYLLYGLPLLGYLLVFLGGPAGLMRSFAASLWNNEHIVKKPIRVTLTKEQLCWTVESHTTSVKWEDIREVEISRAHISFLFHVGWVASMEADKLSKQQLAESCQVLSEWGLSVNDLLAEQES